MPLRALGRTLFTALPTNSSATTCWMLGTFLTEKNHRYGATNSAPLSAVLLSRTRLFSSSITRASDVRRVSQVWLTCHLRLPDQANSRLGLCQCTLVLSR